MLTEPRRPAIGTDGRWSSQFERMNWEAAWALEPELA
jgi:hypothetical protein